MLRLSRFCLLLVFAVACPLVPALVRAADSDPKSPEPAKTDPPKAERPTVTIEEAPYGGSVRGKPARVRAPFDVPAIGNAAASEKTPAYEKPSAETKAKEKSLVESVTEPEFQINLIPSRSRLFITKYPVKRFSITDPNVLTVLQFTPTQFELVGTQPGYSSLTIWFQKPDGDVPVLRAAVEVGGRSGR